MKKGFSAVILAAGAGSRMKSELPKVVHKLSGKPLIKWVIDALLPLKPDNIVVVLGHKSEIVKDTLAQDLRKRSNIKTVYQKEQKGSAHALMQAQKVLKNYNGRILVLSGDVPLIKTSTLSRLLKSGRQNIEYAAVLGAKVENPFGYGRIIRNGASLEKIIEEKDASPKEKEIKEINGGIYCFNKNIWKALSKIKPDNAKKEYYLTDSIEILKDGGKIGFMLADDAGEIKGVNSRKELSEAEKYLNAQKIKELLDGGISFIDTGNVYISYDAKIGRDSVIYPNVFIDGGVTIGRGCLIKGSTYIVNSKIADNTEISYSYVSGAVIGKNVKIGPFSHIRPSSVLKDNVKVGNFSEIKKSEVEKNSKVNHLSYIGDAFVGRDVNIGAGTITCNYDGVKKHVTVIGAKSFVGSNVNFVAPVKVGKGALVAAGSTITKDIPSGKLAIARAAQEHKRRRR